MPAFWRLTLLVIFGSLIVLSVLPSALSSRKLEKHVSRHKHNTGSSHKLGPQLSFQITLHGFLLWASMGFLMPVGILIIRMSTRERCGKRLKILFYSHVIFQVASILLATAGAVLSIKNFENSFSNTHQRIGLALYCVILLQPVIGFCRPHRGIKGRSRWYFVHWALGTGVSLLGILNIYIGLHAYNRRTGRHVGLWTLLFSVEVSLIAFLYLLQDKWDYMKKQGVILSEEPVAPSDQIPASRENSKELAVPCYESIKFNYAKSLVPGGYSPHRSTSSLRTLVPFFPCVLFLYPNFVLLVEPVTFLYFECLALFTAKYPSRNRFKFVGESILDAPTSIHHRCSSPIATWRKSCRVLFQHLSQSILIREMVEEERHKRVESLGWLTESTVLPKRHKAIEGVGPSSILDLKAQLYKTQEEAKQVKDLAPDVEFHRATKKIVSHNIFSQKNSGVESRAKRDKLQLKAEKDGSVSYAALERKADLYEKLVNGELSDEEEREKYCVDFFRKGLEQDSSEQAERRDTPQVPPENEVDDADLLSSAKPVGPGRTGLTINTDEHKRFVREVHEEANQAREKASTLKLRRQAQAAAHREKLKQAYLRKQLEKLIATKAQEETQVSGAGE
ncbi:uncharacterized protein [Aristolochia californica]|uniref:uncharacterized protein n=1 Tax=Aristolochia californica TaxID=171875 RepID=UPI0035D8456E